MGGEKLIISDIFFNFYNGEVDKNAVISGVIDFFVIYPYFKNYFTILDLAQDFLDRV